MQVKVQSIQFSADQKLLNFVSQKVNKLNLFFGNILVSEVFLKVIRANSNNNKLVEIKILGIFLILAAVIFSQLMPIYDKKKYGRN